MGYKIPFILTLILAVAVPVTAKVTNLRCEYLVNPIGIDVPDPRLTWEYTNDNLPVQCHVELSETSDFSTPVLYRSRNCQAAVVHIDSVAGKRYYWRVVETMPGGRQEKSAISTFETGKFSPTQWSAKWISDGLDFHTEQAPVFRSTFLLDKKPGNARAFVSSLGYYDMYINGARVGERHMDPGFTAYDKRSLYATHDVTALLRKGNNVVEVTLGNGFANCQSLDAWGQEKAPWRSRPSFICEITADGKTVAATNENWETALSPVIYNNLYSGEHRDARITPRYDSKAIAVPAPNYNLKSQMMPPIVPVRRLKPVLMKSWGDTIFVFDMGSNIAGVCRLGVKGLKGTEISLAHGELLKPNGRLEQGNLNIYYHPLKNNEAFQTDVYTIGRSDVYEEFLPRFTYHGFRYVELKSTTPLKTGDISLEGIMMRTGIERTGHFRCSNDLLNRIYNATMLSYEDNIHSIPTDCPQREKNGWTADAHVAVDLGLLNFDGITFYEKWMNDFIDNQHSDGNISGIVPSAGWGYGDSPGPVWDAALFIVPTAIYDYYGDKTILERMYPVMSLYMEWLNSLEKEDGTLACGIGDWLPYHTQTPTDFTSTLYAFADYKMMSRISRILGKDASVWESKATQMKDRINAKWLDPDKALYANGSQAAQAIALYWDIVPEEYEKRVAANLNDMVIDNRYALDFGLLGSKSVLRMLTKYGYHDTAFRMATRTEAPSWGHWIDECGYTTLAETWILSPEFRDASLNHVFFGDVVAWLTNDIAGINLDTDNRGFSNIVIRPVFMEGLDWAEADYKSVRGLIKSRWERKADGHIELCVTVPYGCTASVELGDTTKTVGGGNHKFKI